MSKILALFASLAFLLLALAVIPIDTFAKTKMEQKSTHLEQDDDIAPEAKILFPDFGGMFVAFISGDSKYFPEEELYPSIKGNKSFLQGRTVVVNIIAKIVRGKTVYSLYLTSGEPAVQDILHPPDD